jgi:hypothetical protein
MTSATPVDSTEGADFSFIGHWKTLEEDRETFHKSAHALDGIPVRIKRDPVDGVCGVLVPIKHELRWNPGVPAVRMSSTGYKFPEGSGRFLEISCTDNDLLDVFDDLVTRLVARAISTGDVEKSLRDVVQEFRHLFQKSPRSSTPREKTIGLAGELLVMKKLSPHVPDPLDCRLQGGEQQDFHLPGSDVEVKTTATQGKKTITINGVHQLVSRNSVPLHLCHVKLREGQQGFSVEDLFDDLVATGVDQATLMQFCQRSGWSKEGTGPLRFEELGLDFYRVDAGFPRIIPTSFEQGQVPPGIDEVQYQVHLDEARKFLVEGDCDEILKGLSQ